MQLLALAVLVLQAVQDRLIHRVEKPLLTNEALQLGFPHGLLHTITNHGEGNLNSSVSEIVHDVVEEVNRCGVDTHNRCHFQDDVFSFIDIFQI